MSSSGPQIASLASRGHRSLTQITLSHPGVTLVKEKEMFPLGSTKWAKQGLSSNDPSGMYFEALIIYGLGLYS